MTRPIENNKTIYERKRPPSIGTPRPTRVASLTALVAQLQYNIQRGIDPINAAIELDAARTERAILLHVEHRELAEKARTK